MREPVANPLWEPGRAGTPAPTGATCGTCDWRYQGGRGKAVDRCRRHAGARVDPAWTACPAFTAELACETCGACCREAFHVVEVSRRDPFVALHPELIEVEDGRRVLRRNGLGRCPALRGGPGFEEQTADEDPRGGYRCGLYAERPRTCRDFTLGSANCVEARRRVGLTP